MNQPPRILILLLGVCVAIQFACATAPPESTNRPAANNNQPASNANIAPSSSSKAKPSEPPNETSTGSIEVTSVPTGTRVLLIATDADTAGEPQSKGLTPTTITGVRPGKYTVHLERPGYRFFQREITVKKGATIKLAATLKKQ